MGSFELMIWAGAAVTLIGVAGLIACILYVMRLRRAGLDDAAMRAGMRKGVLWNTLALFVSIIGLMLVILGIAFS